MSCPYSPKLKIQVEALFDILYISTLWSCPCVIAPFYRYRTTKKPTILAPLLPLTFGVGYQADLSYGNKINRIKTEAENVRLMNFSSFGALLHSFTSNGALIWQEISKFCFSGLSKYLWQTWLGVIPTFFKVACQLVETSKMVLILYTNFTTWNFKFTKSRLRKNTRTTIFFF